MRTVAYYSKIGRSKAKTDKAILFLDTTKNVEAWLPLRVVGVRFIDKNFGVEVSMPDWFARKVEWKEPSEFKPKAKPANPYIGSDVGNMMEERMVLEEMNPEDPRIALIDAALRDAYLDKMSA